MASKAANLLKSTARFTPAVLARCSAAVPVQGSVAATAMHAAQAIDVAELEIFANTVVTSFGCGAQPLAVCRLRGHGLPVRYEQLTLRNPEMHTKDRQVGQNLT